MLCDITGKIPAGEINPKNLVQLIEAMRNKILPKYFPDTHKVPIVFSKELWPLMEQPSEQDKKMDGQLFDLQVGRQLPIETQANNNLAELPMQDNITEYDIIPGDHDLDEFHDAKDGQETLLSVTQKQTTGQDNKEMQFVQTL